MNYRNKRKLGEPKEGYFGQFNTDVIIELYFNNIEKGKCIEVGVANGTRGSNTLYFENKGWETLCIEPNPEYCKIAKETREKVIQVACGDNDYLEKLPFTIFDIGVHNIMSSVSGLRPDNRLVDEHNDRGLINKEYQIEVDVMKLDTILKQQEFSRDINFISIDTEGTELDVLKGLDLDYWNIDLLVVENNYNDYNIEEHLNKFGYIKDARWKINDFYIRG
tara:strand:- start:1567 stop:2229 length:663 start_codon:yes stop_codon:yes gene_type:complete